MATQDLLNATMPDTASSVGLHQSSASPAQDLSTALSKSPHAFLQAPASLHEAALQLIKEYLDPLASSVSSTQRQRQRDARLKRKRGEYTAKGSVNGPVLRLDKIYLDGFDLEQVWGQARMVLEAAQKELGQSKPLLANGTASPNQLTNGDGFPRKKRKIADSDTVDSPNDHGLKPHQKSVSFADVDGSLDSDEDGSISDDFEDEELLSEDNVPDGSEDDEGSEAESAVSNAHVTEEAGDSGSAEDQDTDAEETPDHMVEDKFGLNDGFFSIDDFNKQAMFFERQDTVDDGVDLDDDDEEINWDANPMTAVPPAGRQTKKKPRNGFPAKEEDNGSDPSDEDEDDDDDGPTFGDVNQASEDDEEDAMLDGDPASLGGLDGMQDTNDIRYDGFFRPPARKAKADDKSRRSKSTALALDKKKNAQDNIGEIDVQRTIKAVKRDLFHDTLSADEDDTDQGTSRGKPSDQKHQKSTFERRQAKIAAEIRRLEAANVAKKEWTLSGEARAADRPLNSLLEEDLDFERTGKPVPVITAEVSESIEEMIKRRIVNQEFDELIRRRPDELLAPADVRRGRFELDDSKPQQSLAEIYEEEHLRRVDPEGHPDHRSEKLKKAHAELEALWADVCADLDGLSNWHYRPKPPKPAINIVADVPTIALEDARPTATVGGNGNLGRTSMLAPQEIYAPGKDQPSSRAGGGGAGTGEVVPKSGLPVATEEMSREEKLRRRRREKERIRKKLAATSDGAAAAAAATTASGTTGAPARASTGAGKKKANEKRREKEAVLEQLKKGGVKIIGRKGEVLDTQGRAVEAAGRDDRARDRVRSSGALKL